GGVDSGGGGLLGRPEGRVPLRTRGSRGMALFEGVGATTFSPSHGTAEMADVTGGGDTVISTFPLALACRAAPAVAAALANVAGGIVVMKRGTATVSRAELRQALGLRGEPARRRHDPRRRGRPRRAAPGRG